MFHEDFGRSLEQPQDAHSERICILCGTERDSYGCCKCDPPAVICMCCAKLIELGKGLPAWEVGDYFTVSHGLCDSCFDRQMELIR